MSHFAVVICGGGVAGIEGLLRLRRLAGDQVDVTVVGPEDHLAYRPLAVLEPFGAGEVRRFPMTRIAADADAHWVRDSLAWVDRDSHTVHTTGGDMLAYDALLLALGGRPRPSDPGMRVFSGRGSDDMFAGLLRDVGSHAVRSIGFVLPAGPCWPLPLYELALLTAQRAAQRRTPLDISVVTPEPKPLFAFGGGAGDKVAELLRAAGITLHAAVAVRVAGPQHLVLEPSGIELHPDQTVTLPTISGPNVRGIPGDAVHRFLPVDPYCRVLGTGRRVFAAGDATDLPVKHGSLAAQQADTAAAGIAHLAGVAEPPDPLRPRIRGKLLTGGSPLYLAAYVIAGQGWQAELYEQPPWPQDDKVIAEELGPYLAGIEPDHAP